ncbi:hypothetical protein BJF78_17690 [Pseudonocardia sp. CNS-139]|nr:hypothetical protein BJF78_17690 [Pseudonocardia sp. CNS-139]
MFKPRRRSVVVLLGIVTGCLLFSSVATAAPAAAPTTASARQAAAELVAATNRARDAAGCDPVAVDPDLTATAQAHAEDMARNEYFSHTSEDGTSSGERITEGGGYAATGENIASGYPTVAEVMEAWMGSASHRTVIENCGYVAIGVGYVARGHHWVQDFGG